MASIIGGGDGGVDHQRGGGDAAVDQWGGATLASIIAVAMGIADSQSRHRWHPSGR